MNNIFLKYFLSILSYFPWLFQPVQNSLTGKCLPIFSDFPVCVGNPGGSYHNGCFNDQEIKEILRRLPLVNYYVVSTC